MNKNYKKISLWLNIFVIESFDWFFLQPLVKYAADKKSGLDDWT